MTRDEVLALSERELRARAAIHLGWTLINDIDGPDPIGVVPTGEYVTIIPYYPRNIAEAWKLVEFLWEKFGFTCTIDKKPLDDKWSVMFAGVDEDSGGTLRAEPFFIATGETAPLAITRAFLLAMEGING